MTGRSVEVCLTFIDSCTARSYSWSQPAATTTRTPLTVRRSCPGNAPLATEGCTSRSQQPPDVGGPASACSTQAAPRPVCRPGMASVRSTVDHGDQQAPTRRRDEPTDRGPQTVRTRPRNVPERNLDSTITARLKKPTLSSEEIIVLVRMDEWAGRRST
jgi:hypothetical protein